MARPRMTPELAAAKAREDFQLEVKLQRVKLSMSQRELSQTLGISAPLMSELLSDPDKLSVSRLRSIIAALDMDPITILRLLGYSEKQLRAESQERDRASDPAATLALVRCR